MLVSCPRELMYVALPPLNSGPKVPGVANLQLYTLTNLATYIDTCIYTYIQANELVQLQ